MILEWGLPVLALILAGLIGYSIGRAGVSMDIERACATLEKDAGWAHGRSLKDPDSWGWVYNRAERHLKGALIVRDYVIHGKEVPTVRSTHEHEDKPREWFSSPPDEEE